MPRIDEEELEEFERLLDRMERAGQSGGSDWVVRHQEFHGRICALSQRPKLIHQISALHVVIEPYMRIWFDDVDKPLSAREEHAVVIAALRSGNPRQAEQVMQDHILGTAPMLTEFVTRGR
jgi:DNA-binding GntR family transcriptional regulator